MGYFVVCFNFPHWQLLLGHELRWEVPERAMRIFRSMAVLPRLVGDIGVLPEDVAQVILGCLFIANSYR